VFLLNIEAIDVGWLKLMDGGRFCCESVSFDCLFEWLGLFPTFRHMLTSYSSILLCRRRSAEWSLVSSDCAPGSGFDNLDRLGGMGYVTSRFGLLKSTILRVWESVRQHFEAGLDANKLCDMETSEVFLVLLQCCSKAPISFPSV